MRSNIAWNRCHVVGMSLPSSGLGTTDCRAGESEGGAGFGALKLGGVDCDDCKML